MVIVCCLLFFALLTNFNPRLIVLGTKKINELNYRSMKKYIITSIITLLYLVVPGQVYAAKTRTWTNSTATTKTVTATKPSYVVKFRADRRAINITMYNIKLASSIAYELTYVGNGIEQGAAGSVLPSEGTSASRLLLFGTCSHAVCSYHKNIQSAKLVISSKMPNGKTYIKRYQIKV